MIVNIFSSFRAIKLQVHKTRLNYLYIMASINFNSVLFPDMLISPPPYQNMHFPFSPPFYLSDLKVLSLQLRLLRLVCLYSYFKSIAYSYFDLLSSEMFDIYHGLRVLNTFRKINYLSYSLLIFPPMHILIIFVVF